MRLGEEDGWVGVFTRDQVEGAIPNGTRIVKARRESGDATTIGTQGTVLGSIDAASLGQQAPDGTPVTYVYFVEFDSRPRVAVGIMDWKIERNPCQGS